MDFHKWMKFCIKIHPVKCYLVGITYLLSYHKDLILLLWFSECMNPHQIAGSKIITFRLLWFIIRHALEVLSDHLLTKSNCQASFLKNLLVPLIEFFHEFGTKGILARMTFVDIVNEVCTKFNICIWDHFNCPNRDWILLIIY